MKIGIIVYSQTGNTLQVAEKLKVKLMKVGNNVVIDEIKALRENSNIKLTNIPDISKYDGVIFATFTEGFSLCPIMDKYIKQVKQLDGKKISGFVTQHFPYPWMGGNRAIKQLKKVCSLTGCTLTKTGIINWSNKKRDEMIEKLINDLTCYFQKDDIK